MNKKIFFKAILFIICLNSLQLNAQSALDKLKNETALTPQAAAFAKYVEFPVSLYNGLANISIPLYTIECGDIILPISLSYHAGGIKVAEEASWVGLGWNLNANGVITRQINGKDDYANPGSNYFDEINPHGEYNYRDTYTNYANVGVCNALGKNGNLITSTLSNAQFKDLVINGDGEPDTYLYNFGNFSGKFINTGGPSGISNNIYDITGNNIQFIVDINKIAAKTPDGYMYEFSVTESSRVFMNTPTITSYYLTKITSPTGKHIDFIYDTTSQDIRLITTRSEEYSAATYAPGESGSHGMSPQLNRPKSPQTARPVYLSKITFDGGYVDFITDTRNDTYGKRLDKIEVHYNDGPLFNYINGSLFKTFTMNQTYFIGISTPHYLDDETPEGSSYPLDFLKQRLKLTSVSEECSGNLDPLVHQFEYYEGGSYTLPYKSSYAVDYWGYYNGCSLNSGFIPLNAGYSLPTVWDAIKNYAGSNRQPNENYAKANMLKSIIYPTKGVTEYEYSLNEYTNPNGLPPKYGWVPLTSKPTTDIGVGVQEQTFTLTSAKDVTIKVSLFCDAAYNYNLCNGTTQTGTWNGGNRMLDGGPYNANGYPTSSLYAELDVLNPTNGQYTPVNNDVNYIWDVNDILPCGNNSSGYFVKNVTLAAGTYKMVANYPDSKTGVLGSKMAQMEVGYMGDYYDPLLGGGLRVTKITHHDPISNTNLTQSYQYTGGIMMHFPSFAWRSQFTYLESSLNPYNPNEGTTWYSTTINDNLYSNPVNPYSTSANGNAVGYNQVTVTTSGGQNGKTEYMYENQPDNFLNFGLSQINGYSPVNDVNSFAPGIPSTPHIKNGFLKQITMKDNNNIPVKITTNTPQELLCQTYWAFKGDMQSHLSYFDIGNPTPFSCETPFSACFMYYFYPIQMGKVLPKTTTEQEIVNSVPITTEKNYLYNSHAFLQSEKVSNSSGKVSATEYKYANEYNNNITWVNDLNNKNMIGVPLETLFKVDNLVIGGSFIKYKTHDGLTTPNEIYSIETTKAKTIASTAPDGILAPELKLKAKIENDANGNIISEKGNDDIVTSYIWGYNNSLPIAKIVNAEYSKVEEALGGSQAIKSFNANISNNAKDFLTPLYSNTTLNNAMITIYTYDVLKGKTSSTDPRGVTTYYYYDEFGRLNNILDFGKNVLQKFEYHFKGQL